MGVCVSFSLGGILIYFTSWVFYVIGFNYSVHGLLCAVLKIKVLITKKVTGTSAILNISFSLY